MIISHQIFVCIESVAFHMFIFEELYMYIVPRYVVTKELKIGNYT